MERTSKMVRVVVLGALTLGIGGCLSADESSEASASVSSAIASVVSLSPTSDVVNTHVWGGGGGTPIYALVDDGKSFASSNDNDFARSAPGAATAAITFGYSGAPANGASKVVVNHRAWALAGAVGSVQVKLYDGATLIGTGPKHALTATRTNFSDTFSNLKVANGDSLRTEIDFANSSGGSTSLGETIVWIDVTPGTPPSNELLRAEYPHAFVSNATGQPVRLNGFNLREVGSGGWAVAQSEFDAVKAKGFNMMRLAVPWGEYEPTKGNFNAANLAALDLTIARCKAAGLYVVLDPIHANSGVKFPAWAVQSTDANDFDTVLREAPAYLTMIAKRYANEPQVVAVDLLNEPQTHVVDPQWDFKGYDQLIGIVRPLMPNKILVVEPISGNFDPRKLDFSALTDKSNLIYSFHYYYAGGDDDGYGASGWANAGNFTWNGTAGYPVRNKAQLQAHLQVNVDAMKTVGLPIWMGEYGIGAGVANHDAWFQDVVSIFDAADVSRTLWEYHWGGMAAVDANKNFYPWVPLLLQ